MRCPAGPRWWPGATGRCPRWWTTAGPASSSPRWRRWAPPSTGPATSTRGRCGPGSRSGSRTRPWWPGTSASTSASCTASRAGPDSPGAGARPAPGWADRPSAALGLALAGGPLGGGGPGLGGGAGGLGAGRRGLGPGRGAWRGGHARGGGPAGRGPARARGRRSGRCGGRGRCGRGGGRAAGGPAGARLGAAGGRDLVPGLGALVGGRVGDVLHPRPEVARDAVDDPLHLWLVEQLADAGGDLVVALAARLGAE